MQIFTYDNGDDLIAAHTDECMDLILLDVIMPLLNGIDTAAELRANGQDVSHYFSNFLPWICSWILRGQSLSLSAETHWRNTIICCHGRIPGKQFCKTKEPLRHRLWPGFLQNGRIEEVACLEAAKQTGTCKPFQTGRRSQSVNHFISAKRYSIWIWDLSSVIAAIS